MICIWLPRWASNGAAHRGGGTAAKRPGFCPDLAFVRTAGAGRPRTPPCWSDCPRLSGCSATMDLAVMSSLATDVAFYRALKANILAGTGEQAGKDFFSEEKKQKTFINGNQQPTHSGGFGWCPKRMKVLFLIKERLDLLPTAPRARPPPG